MNKLNGSLAAVLVAVLGLIGACSKQEAAPAVVQAPSGENNQAVPEYANAAAQAPPPPNSLETSSVVLLPHGSVQRSSIWALDSWEGKPDKEIEVCWENPGAASAHLRDVVANAAATTWARYSPLKFVGWVQCADTSKGIRIYIEDDGPHVKALGRYLANYPHGMVLNFTFQNWSTSCQQRVDFCVWVVAAHEFGHAIGFAHEQNRPDAPWECRRDHHQGTDGDWNLTEYDPASIMNYCNVQWNNDGRLSQRDIEAVQQLYGARAP